MEIFTGKGKISHEEMQKKFKAELGKYLKIGNKIKLLK